MNYPNLKYTDALLQKFERITTEQAAIFNDPKIHEPKMSSRLYSASYMMPYFITTQALERLSLSPLYVTENLYNKISPLVIAFGIFGTIGISNFIIKEGIDLDIKSLTLRAATPFCLGLSHDDSIYIGKKSLDKYLEILNSKSSAVEKWYDTYMMGLQTYLIQENTDDQSIRNIDTDSVFADLLRVIINYPWSKSV